MIPLFKSTKLDLVKKEFVIFSVRISLECILIR